MEPVSIDGHGPNQDRISWHIFLFQTNIARLTSCFARSYVCIIILKCGSARWWKMFWKQRVTMEVRFCKLIRTVFALLIRGLKCCFLTDLFYVLFWNFVTIKTRHNMFKNLRFPGSEKPFLLSTSRPKVESPFILFLQSCYMTGEENNSSS